MIRQRSWSIRQQLLSISSLLMLTVALVTFASAKQYGDQAAELSYDRLLAGAALQAAESIQNDQGIITIDLPKSVFELLALAPEDRIQYQILGPGNEHLTGYEWLSTHVALHRHKPVLKKEEPQSIAYFDHSILGEKARFVVLVMATALIDSDLNGEVIILFGQTTAARSSLSEEISWRATQLVLIVFVISGLLLAIAIVWTLQPIHKLNKALITRSPIDLSPLTFSVPSEIRPLQDNINHFMQQFGEVLDRLERFNSEAAHQLRTPLAGMRSQTQNALEESDHTLRRFQLERVLTARDTLSSTVVQLLEQAQLAHRLRTMPMKPLNLGSIVQDVCREVAISALNQGIELAYHNTANAVIIGDRFSLTQMFRNLIENAIKYSPGKGCIDIHLMMETHSAGHQQYVLSVSDHGIGIPDDDKPNVFERFYRSANNTRTGSGLGLSIAREVAEHHHAHMELLDNTPTGLIVRVLFPLPGRRKK